jgi:hypothetical protein
MTIHPRPDQEIQIQEAIKAGLIHSAEDVIDAGLESLREKHAPLQPVEDKGETLVEFFRRSPLVGLELDLERDKDTGRDIDI